MPTSTPRFSPAPTAKARAPTTKPSSACKDGATWQQADAEINRAWAYRVSQIESKNPGTKIAYYTVPLQRGMTAELRPRAIALMLSAGFILLIACANLAGLTLVRMARASS